MRTFRNAGSSLRRFFAAPLPMIAVAQTMILAAAPGTAAPVTVSFEPPAIEAQPICSNRAIDTELVAWWEAWDGSSLQGRDAADVQREIRRLRELDPVRWYDKIDAAITLLPTVSAAFTEERAMVERIELMLAAGKGSKVAIETTGADEQAALDAIVALINDKFGEGE